MTRKYVLTIAQLIDRLCIVTLKSIKIPENKAEYEKEANDIMYDLSNIIPQIAESGKFLRAVIVNSIANEVIWQNESKARIGMGDQDHMLRFTHSVNGVRTVAMNAMSMITKERVDLKTDCLASEICKMNGYDFSDLFSGYGMQEESVNNKSI